MTKPTERDREMARAALSDDGLYPHFCARMMDEADIAKIIAAAREEGRREAQWRPIETAPKDGTVFDLWVTYQKDGVVTLSERAAKCRWGFVDVDPDGIDRDEWVDDNDDMVQWGPDKYGQSCVVTHWCPLPEAPADG